jgi:hypothetical protein
MDNQHERKEMVGDCGDLHDFMHEKQGREAAYSPEYSPEQNVPFHSRRSGKVLIVVFWISVACRLCILLAHDNLVRCWKSCVSFRASATRRNARLCRFAIKVGINQQSRGLFAIFAHSRSP